MKTNFVNLSPEQRVVISTLRDEMSCELQQNILPFWMNKMVDFQDGGFYGRMAGNGELDVAAAKGAILNARILWTFSSAYRLFKNDEYLRMATRAKQYLIDKFIDKEFGGVYWKVDKQGHVVDAKKQIYAIGFAIYGLSEYARATGDEEALNCAIALFDVVEKYAFDTEYGGYMEALTYDWRPIGDMRLSDKDANEKKTMNTHLHILEPYTNLYKVWPSEKLASKIKPILTVFTDKIWDNKCNHLNLFFSQNWSCRSHIVSYGHEIEASWLIDEAVAVLNDVQLTAHIEPFVNRLVQAAIEGLNPDGSINYELDKSTSYGNTDRHWWTQAECVVGFFNCYQHFGGAHDLQYSVAAWNFIKSNLIDKNHGEWYWSVNEFGEKNTTDDKAGFWKCPYHNGRMCMEIIERVANI